jgi:hypothetical protein
MRAHRAAQSSRYEEFVMKILSMSEAAALIERVIKSTNESMVDLHLALVSSLDHIREHGNTTGLLRLLNGLPRGIRLQGIVAWTKEFSNGKCAPGLNPKTKQWQIELAKDRKDADFNIEAAFGTTFADLTAEKAPSTMTADSLLTKLKQIASNTKLNKDDSPKVTVEARSLAMQAIQFLETAKKKAA